MHTSLNSTVTAWVAFLLAIVAWAGVVLFAFSIQTQESDHTTHVQAAQAQTSQDSKLSYVHALVTESAGDRSELDSLVNVDPATLADLVNTAGKSSGAAIQISDASSDNAPSTGAAGTQAFGFIAGSAGSFATVMYAAQLLETLPVPSSIQEIQLVHVTNPSTPGATWQMNAQVRVITASAISS